MITKEELKELLSVLNYFMIGGLMLGITCATVVAMGDIAFVRTDYGLPVPTKVITATIVILIGAMTGLVAYLILLPAELKLVRQKLSPILLARRLSGKK
ncbi:MAG: hypothetical protein HZB51_16595 [Chloroflexi bacterium]|nr:hypothetical protein [Chloroflexota bacterium]